jgi:hypothetical protein
MDFGTAASNEGEDWEEEGSGVGVGEAIHA